MAETDLAKNPYDSSLPEWQLYENMRGLRLTASAFDDDAARALRRAAEARNKADLFQAALAKLDPERWA